MTIYYFFLRRSLDDSCLSTPYLTNTYLGDIGDFIELDGVGYIIEDYTTEEPELVNNDEIRNPATLLY